MEMLWKQTCDSTPLGELVLPDSTHRLDCCLIALAADLSSHTDHAQTARLEYVLKVPASHCGMRMAHVDA